MRATVESHESSPHLPPVRVMVALGQEDLAIKVRGDTGPAGGPEPRGVSGSGVVTPRHLLQMSDRGLGVPLRKIDRLFSYMYSTAPTPALGDGGAPLVCAPVGAAGSAGPWGTSPRFRVAGGCLGVAGAAGGGLSLTWALLGTFCGAHGWHGDTWGGAMGTRG